MNAKRQTLFAGIGGIAFGVLPVVAFVLGNPPGANAARIADFVALGHRPAVVAALYLAMLGVFGLISLLAYLRDAIERNGRDKPISEVFWGTGVVAAGAYAVGYVVNLGPAFSLAPTSNLGITAPGIYLVLDVGAGILIHAGVLLALALITLALSVPSPLPAWLRWLTLALGVVGLASPAFLPWLALFLWGIVTGVWVLASGQAASTVRSA